MDEVLEGFSQECKEEQKPLPVKARRYRMAQTICMPLVYIYIVSTRFLVGFRKWFMAEPPPQLSL